MQMPVDIRLVSAELRRVDWDMRQDAVAVLCRPEDRVKVLQIQRAWVAVMVTHDKFLDPV